MRHLLPFAGAALAVLTAVLAPSCASVDGTDPDGPPVARLDESELGSFTPVARVLRHQRCMNCHPAGDRPHVGDDRRVHAMNVQRGPDGHGYPAQHCSACHRDQNQDYAKVPGAPHWHLAPRSMGWEGLDDRRLAEVLTDRSLNGDRSLADLRNHMAEDPLVGWGWAPGVGREAIPLPQDEFLTAFDAWVEAGAPLPEPGVTSNF